MKVIDNHHERISLARRQQQLVQEIFDFSASPLLVPSRSRAGVQTYQNNLLMTAARALTITYPVIEKMLGAEAIRVLAKSLLDMKPPSSGDWAEWGGDLADALTLTPIIQDYPYLYGMAKLEWKLHQVGRSKDQTINLASINRLTDNDLSGVWIQLVDALSLQKSTYPLDILWKAHQSQDTNFQLDIETLAQAIHEHQGPCCLMIYKQHQIAKFKSLSEQEFQWLTDIYSGYSIADLLDRHPSVDFAHWFSSAIEQNWIKELSLTSHYSGEQS